LEKKGFFYRNIIARQKRKSHIACANEPSRALLQMSIFFTQIKSQFLTLFDQILTDQVRVSMALKNADTKVIIYNYLGTSFLAKYECQFFNPNFCLIFSQFLGRFFF
jgi:hypothetical protein